MLTYKEREVVLNYLFDSDIAFLVENMMVWIPEDVLKNLAKDLINEEN